ncbi:conserved hypothetical protein [Ricinus communis]|uniref:Uncharacterized protein n=1 Tax=Ricinus communis TaxID=3988 RepID=B9SHU5_RICCO|nr:conserved hypothetical protein [Ricinus communis]
MEKSSFKKENAVRALKKSLEKDNKEDKVDADDNIIADSTEIATNVKKFVDKVVVALKKMASAVVLFEKVMIEIGRVESGNNVLKKFQCCFEDLQQLHKLLERQSN